MGPGDLVPEDAQCSVDAMLPTRHEPVEVRPADEAAPGPEVGHGRDDVGAVHDPVSKQDLGPPESRVDEYPAAPRRVGWLPVELPTPVVGHDAVDAKLRHHLRVFGASGCP